MVLPVTSLHYSGHGRLLRGDARGVAGDTLVRQATAGAPPTVGGGGAERARVGGGETLLGPRAAVPMEVYMSEMRLCQYCIIYIDTFQS